MDNLYSIDFTLEDNVNENWKISNPLKNSQIYTIIKFIKNLIRKLNKSEKIVKIRINWNFYKEKLLLYSIDKIWNLRLDSNKNIQIIIKRI